MPNPDSPPHKGNTPHNQARGTCGIKTMADPTVSDNNVPQLMPPTMRMALVYSSSGDSGVSGRLGIAQCLGVLEGGCLRLSQLAWVQAIALTIGLVIFETLSTDVVLTRSGLGCSFLTRKTRSRSLAVTSIELRCQKRAPQGSPKYRPRRGKD